MNDPVRPAGNQDLHDRGFPGPETAYPTSVTAGEGPRGRSRVPTSAVKIKGEWDSHRAIPGGEPV